MADYSSKLLQGSLIIFIAGIFSSILGYFIRIILARKLTIEQFGLFFAVYNVILLIGWLKGFGLSSTVGKYIPKFNVEKNYVSVKSILVFVTAFTLLSNLLFFVIIYFLPVHLITSYFQSDIAKQILLLLFVYIFIDGLSTIFNSYFLSIYHFVLYSSRDIIIRGLVLLLILLITDLTIFQVALIYVVAASINLVIHIIYFLKYFSFFRYKLKIDLNLGKELFGFSIPLMIRDIFGVLMARVDNLLLVFFRPLAEVGLYNVILPTADMLLIFSRPFGRIMFPMSSELLALHEKIKIKFFLEKIHHHLLLFLVPFSVTIFMFSSFILKTLFGAIYEAGYLGLDILIFGFLFTSLNMVSYSVLLGVGKQKEAARITILSNILNLILNVILIPYFGKSGQGYLGAIIGTVVSTLCLYFLLLYYLRKSIDYTFQFNSYLSLFLIGTFLTISGYFIKRNIVGAYAQITIFVIFLLLFYPVLIFLFKLTTFTEIKFIINALFKKEKDGAYHQNVLISFFDKIGTYTRPLWWYIKNPPYYGELLSQVFQKTKNYFSLRNKKRQRDMALRWCAETAVDIPLVISKITSLTKIEPFEEKFKDHFIKSKRIADNCPVRMGGPGNLTLLYHLTEHLQATKVIETGVAYGWSSLAILLSLQHRPHARLISIDKPYPGQGNEPYVGCVVPEELRSQWEIIRLADRKAVPRALRTLGSIDLCHYDSDKSYEGRMRSYPLLWKALRPGGVFISDDIGDNLAFHDFCRKIKRTPFIVKDAGKYIGIILK